MSVSNQIKTKQNKKMTTNFFLFHHENILTHYQDSSTEYGQYPKISFSKASEKMAHANSVDPGQTAPSGAV